MLSDPSLVKISSRPTSRAVSPTRVTMKAFRAAAPFAGSRYQNPMSKKLLSPTPSQPTSKKRKSSANTRMSIEAMNRFI